MGENKHNNSVYVNTETHNRLESLSGYLKLSMTDILHAVLNRFKEADFKAALVEKSKNTSIMVSDANFKMLNNIGVKNKHLSRQAIIESIFRSKDWKPVLFDHFYPLEAM